MAAGWDKDAADASAEEFGALITAEMPTSELAVLLQKYVKTCGWRRLARKVAALADKPAI